MPLDTIHITSWAEFVSLADKCDDGQVDLGSYCFRGQTNADWSLTPRLLRQIRAAELPEFDALAIEMISLDAFRAQAHLHIAPSVLSSTTGALGWWTLMQHHGAPTRLLDWTRSMYIAAYFAVNSDPAVDGAVWIIHRYLLQARVNDLLGRRSTDIPLLDSEFAETFLARGRPHTLSFFSNSSVSDRMAAQQGLFSVSQSILGDHTQIIEQSITMPEDKLRYGKVIIPSRLKLPFLRKLRNVNITSASLFPGLDGFAQSVAELVMLKEK